MNGKKHFLKILSIFKMKYSAINHQLFIDNRKKFIAELPPNSMAIFFAIDDVVFAPGTQERVHTGISLEIPD